MMYNESDASSVKTINSIIKNYGLAKNMGKSNEGSTQPHYYLLRKFVGVVDLLLILNTKRCRYQCFYCNLPRHSSRKWISGKDVIKQYVSAMSELRHGLHLVDRFTISNEGSVLDFDTFPEDALKEILLSSAEIKSLKEIFIESRVEFAQYDVLNWMKSLNEKVTYWILTGFETLNDDLRTGILGRREEVNDFLEGLDRLSANNIGLASYIIYKPAPVMTDEEAYLEAKETCDFLITETRKRNIPLLLRINPMYVAAGTRIEKQVNALEQYTPPNLHDVMKLADYVRQNSVDVYIGLSDEGLSKPHYTYRGRPEFSKDQIKECIKFNDNPSYRFSMNRPT